MRKLWRRLCFLVLAFSSVSRGQNETTVAPDLSPPTPPPMGSDETQNESSSTLETPVFKHTSAITTDLPSTNLTTKEDLVSEDFNGTTEEDSNSKTLIGISGANTVMTTVSIETDITSLTPVTSGGTGHSSWGYVLLVLIIVAIIILCVMLYFLRRVSRTYSFDLHRPIPSNHRNDPIGTFEPVYLDDLAPKAKETLKTFPLSSGIQRHNNSDGGTRIQWRERSTGTVRSKRFGGFARTHRPVADRRPRGKDLQSIGKHQHLLRHYRGGAAERKQQQPFGLLQ